MIGPVQSIRMSLPLSCPTFRSCRWSCRSFSRYCRSVSRSGVARRLSRTAAALLVASSSCRSGFPYISPQSEPQDRCIGGDARAREPASLDVGRGGSFVDRPAHPGRQASVFDTGLPGSTSCVHDRVPAWTGRGVSSMKSAESSQEKFLSELETASSKTLRPPMAHR